MCLSCSGVRSGVIPRETSPQGVQIQPLPNPRGGGRHSCRVSHLQGVRQPVLPQRDLPPQCLPGGWGTARQVMKSGTHHKWNRCVLYTTITYTYIHTYIHTHTHTVYRDIWFMVHVCYSTCTPYINMFFMFCLYLCIKLCIKGIIVQYLTLCMIIKPQSGISTHYHLRFSFSCIHIMAVGKKQ